MIPEFKTIEKAYISKRTSTFPLEPSVNVPICSPVKSNSEHRVGMDRSHRRG